MTSEAFLYYLPALLSFAVADGNDSEFSGQIVGRFVCIQIEPISEPQSKKVDELTSLSSRLSMPQRTALCIFFESLRDQEYQCPMFLDAAAKCVENGIVEPIRHSQVLEWAKKKEDSKDSQPR